jgi:hypothetical protein
MEGRKGTKSFGYGTEGVNLHRESEKKLGKKWQP